MMSTTSSSAYSSFDSFYSADSDWTDASSMTTPSKAGVNGLSNQKRDNMIPTLRADIQDVVYKDCTVEHFIQHIWGVSPSTIETILSAEWTLDANALSHYDYVLDPSNTLREPDLHAPFRSIASKLVLDAHILLGNSSATLVEQFWDGNGSAVISSKYTKRKPDLLSLWGSVPEWSKVRNPVEFKIEPKSNVTGSSVSLLPITEDPGPSKPRGSPPPSSSRQPQDMSPSVAAQGRRAKKRELANRRSRTGTVSCSRGTSSGAGPSRLENGSTIASGTSLKRPRSAEDDDLASVASAKKRSRYAANYLTQHQLQLATYALECLSVSSRQYATGILINSRKVTLWYFDRTAVIRTVPFDFGKDSGPAQLALVLYALSECDVCRAGFLPYLHRIKLPEEDDAIVPESAIQPLEQPPSDLTETCLMFPEPGNPKSKRFFLLRNIIYAYRGLVGRGSMVYETLDGVQGARLPKEISILKLSWQYLFRRHEGEIITHLRNAIPAWKDHLPELCFSATFSAEELDLPWVRMKLEDLGSRIKSRRLDVIASRKYKNLWKAGSIEEFKQAFIDCVECHYHAYTTGRVLHRDLSDHNLMLWHPELDCPTEDLTSSPCSTDTAPLANSTSMPGVTPKRPSVLGILNDWDMASELTEDGEIPNSAALHRTGTLPFMAADLLVTPPPPHYYRHDLESFFYILIWAAVHYDLKKKTRRPTSKVLAVWGDQNHALASKLSMFGPGTGGNAFRESILKLTGKEFQDIRVQWILPLRNLFLRSFQSVPAPDEPEFATYDHVTCNGQITFETFMAAIGIKPRSMENGSGQ